MTAAHALGGAVCKDVLLTASLLGCRARLTAPGLAPAASSTGRWSDPDAAAVLAIASLAYRARLQCIFGQSVTSCTVAYESGRTA